MIRPLSEFDNGLAVTAKCLEPGWYIALKKLYNGVSGFEVERLIDDRELRPVLKWASPRVQRNKVSKSNDTDTVDVKYFFNCQFDCFSRIDDPARVGVMSEEDYKRFGEYEMSIDLYTKGLTSYSDDSVRFRPCVYVKDTAYDYDKPITLYELAGDRTFTMKSRRWHDRVTADIEKWFRSCSMFSAGNRGHVDVLENDVRRKMTFSVSPRSGTFEQYNFVPFGNIDTVPDDVRERVMLFTHRCRIGGYVSSVPNCFFTYSYLTLNCLLSMLMKGDILLSDLVDAGVIPAYPFMSSLCFSMFQTSKLIQSVPCVVQYDSREALVRAAHVLERETHEEIDWKTLRDLVAREAAVNVRDDSETTVTVFKMKSTDRLAVMGLVLIHSMEIPYESIVDKAAKDDQKYLNKEQAE